MLRLLLELDILVPAWLLVELAIPILRDRPRLPVTRWLLRRVLALIPSRTPADALVSSAEARRKSARLRLGAATRDRQAAELEALADRLESETNRLRTEGERDDN